MRAGPAATGLTLVMREGVPGGGLLLVGLALLVATGLALAGGGRLIGRVLAGVAGVGVLVALVCLARAPAPAGWGALGTTAPSSISLASGSREAGWCAEAGSSAGRSSGWRSW